MPTRPKLAKRSRALAPAPAANAALISGACICTASSQRSQSGAGEDRSGCQLRAAGAVQKGRGQGQTWAAGRRRAWDMRATEGLAPCGTAPMAIETLPTGADRGGRASCTGGGHSGLGG
jgi:hypothetical protein